MPLNGFVAPHDRLAPGTAFEALPAGVRAVVRYEPADLWAQDTAMLPRSLGAYRRRLRAFAQRTIQPRAFFEDAHTASVGHDASRDPVLRVAGKAGYLSDFLPRPFGGLDWRLLRHPIPWLQSLKMEEFCAACGGIGLRIGANALGAAPILFSGDASAIRRHLLPAFRHSGQGDPRVFAFAITEPGGGSDVEDGHGAKTYRPMTTARRATGGWRLNGRKVFISGGDIAHAVCVFAALETADGPEGIESWTCFLVEKAMPGFQVVRTENKMGQRASGAAELLFEDVFVPDTHVIGELREGWAINRAVLNYSRIPVGAIALGIARGACEAAVAFAARHKLAGRRLLDYQDVQLAVAQMYLDLNAMRATIWQAAAKWRPTQSRASMAKVFCSDMSLRVCERAMELMGDHALAHGAVEKAYRDARLTQIYEGTNQINRLAVIEDLMTTFSRNDMERR